MKVDLPPLPYSFKALAPHISERTLSLHYTRHQQGYIDRLNEIPEVEGLGQTSIEALVIRGAHGKRRKGVLTLPKGGLPSNLFNMAAQVYNHTFYWRSMKPKGGGVPTGEIARGIDQHFGDVETFRTNLKEAGDKLFGSGWVWVVIRDGKLAIITSSNAVPPFIYGMSPLLVIDVWEHAYYLDYQNDRGAYLTAIIDHLLNWDFANENLEHM